MALLNVLRYPDPRLRQRAQPVETITPDILRLIDDMFETMYAAPGIGLAAIQVNVPVRVITIDVTEGQNQPLCLINPKILTQSGSERMDEGCLSVPGIYEPVERATHIIFQALDRNGQIFKRDSHGLLSVCVQHEIDHLEGKLFVDYLSELKRNRIRKKLEKQVRQTF
ncbi:peptide deformylase [Gammaproteobacteria bacterium]